MRAIVALVAAAGVLSMTASTARAQDDSGDVAAWFAMMFSPYGALPPLVSRSMAGAPADSAAVGAFEIKYGRWGFDGAEDGWHTFGLGGRVGRVGFTFGYGSCEGCSGEGVMMGGADFESVLARSPFGTEASAASFIVTVRPSLGFGKFTEGGGYAIAANADLPVSFSMPVGQRSRLVPFVAPGFGIGLAGGNGESETGVRMAMAAGAGFFVSPQFGVHLAWRKIFIEDGPSIVGIGVSFGR